MHYVSDTEQKIVLVRETFSELIGETIHSYELAQLWYEEEQEWMNWMDVPIFLVIGASILSISWQKLDELGLATGRALPFSLVGSTVRWVSEGIQPLDAILGQRVVSVALGMEEASAGDTWTRLLINLDSGKTFEIYNALDENGFALRDTTVQSAIKPCV
ncbi:MAG: hypothetical protein AAGF95_23170 [Chloroflexota bacterium]